MKDVMQRNKTKEELLEQLLYSNVFRHPLTAEELIKYTSGSLSLEDIRSSLNEMIKTGLVHQSDEFYYVFSKGEKIQLRIEGQKKAAQLTPKAYKIARFINKFPFIEGVGISGSLSKGILHDDADFDFFIITQPNRLWVARTLLILYKKVFLLNSRKYFCVNYFVDSEHLEIEEQNRFTAIEISTLIPVAGKSINAFFIQNLWVNNYFPNADLNHDATPQLKKPLLGRFIQFLLKGRLGEAMDKRMMKITFKRWNKKFGDFDKDKFDLTMKSRRYISKHHPNDFQSKVLKRHQDVIEEYRIKYANELQEQGVEL